MNFISKSNRSKVEPVYAFDTQNQIKGNPPFSVMHESPDEFIDHLAKGKEINLGVETISPFTLLFEARL